MQVFKGYMKIVLRNIGLLIMYMGITVSIVVIIEKNMPAGGAPGSFSAAKSKVAVIDREGGILADTLRRYMASEQTLVELKDDPAVIQNELFYRNVSYVLIVPEDAREALEAGEPAVQTITVPGSSEGYYLDAAVTMIFNEIRICRAGGLSLEDACQKALEVSREKADVTLLDLNGNGGERTSYNYLFLYLPYGMLGGMIMCLSTVTMEFKKKEIKRRTACSPAKFWKQNLAAAACFFTVGLTIWCVYIVMQTVLYRGGILTSRNALYYMANSLALTAVAMSLSYLAGMTVRKPAALNGINNIITLGLCFLGGIFVPVEMLGSRVKIIAQFLPTYWYAQINGILGDFETLNREALCTFYRGLLIQLLFAAACFCVTMAVNKAGQRE